MGVYLSVVVGVLVLAASALAESPDRSGEWSQWRGPGRDGRAEIFGALDDWPAEPRVVWDIGVGEGQSSPVIGGHRLLLFDRLDGAERLSAIDLESGEVLWRESEPVQFKPGMGAGRYGAGPKSTPTIVGESVVSYGASSALAVRDLSTGELRWRRDLQDEARDPTLYYGNSMSR